MSLFTKYIPPVPLFVLITLTCILRLPHSEESEVVHDLTRGVAFTLESGFQSLTHWTKIIISSIWLLYKIKNSELRYLVILAKNITNKTGNGQTQQNKTVQFITEYSMGVFGFHAPAMFVS